MQRNISFSPCSSSRYASSPSSAPLTAPTRSGVREGHPGDVAPLAPQQVPITHSLIRVNRCAFIYDIPYYPLQCILVINL
ncbi:hypothetical protein HanRHA438_Chr09g0418431 [Helianthus annuus]|nr:hypothetical protein HanRHA438_Chr09g0418431 [Helianthus annuus]